MIAGTSNTEFTARTHNTPETSYSVINPDMPNMHEGSSDDNIPYAYTKQFADAYCSPRTSERLDASCSPTTPDTRSIGCQPKTPDMISVACSPIRPEPDIVFEHENLYDELQPSEHDSTLEIA